MSQKKGGGRFKAVPSSNFFGPDMGRRISLSNTILKLEAAIKEVEARFDALKDKGIALQEKRAEIDRAISENVTEMVRVQGENRALLAMLEQEKLPETTEKAN